MFRSAIVRAARTELGNTDPSRYWLDVLDPPQADPRDASGKPLSWCGASHLYFIHQGAPETRRVKWIPGRGFVGPMKLRTTKTPRPADTAYRHKGQHYATVVEVGDGWVSTVDGNSVERDAKGRITRSGVVALHERTPIAEWDAFYDVEPLFGGGVA